VVRGEVFGRVRVDDAADLLQQPRVLLGWHARRALEHHVLEHVRDAADAHVFVLGAHVIEDLHGRDRRLVIGQEQHLQPVGQRPALDVQLRHHDRRGLACWRLTRRLGRLRGASTPTRHAGQNDGDRSGAEAVGVHGRAGLCHDAAGEQGH
jgi:hypothetical protein